MLSDYLDGALPVTWIRRILLFKKGPRGPSNAGEKVLMVL